MHYIYYKRFKSKFSYTYRGIKLNQVLAIDIWNWISKYGIDSIPIRHQWKKSLDWSFMPNYESDNIMFSDVNRKDHQKTFFDIVDKVKGEYFAIDASNNLHERRHISLKNLFIAFYWMFNATQSFDYTLRQRMKLASYLCFILNTIDELYSANPKPLKRYVAYSAIHPWENLLCQYYKIKGAKTFGLSHGLFPLFKNNIPVDCLNYENLDVDCCLVWGEMSKDVYQRSGISGEKLKVAGYPKQIKTAKVSPNNSLRKCLILLSRPQFDGANISLLEILKEFSKDYKFELKLHPMCDYEKYRRIAEECGFTILDKSVQLTDCMNNELYDFAVAVNTSTYYEIMAAGIPCMRYDHGEDYDLMYGDEHDRVSSAEDFLTSVEWMRAKIQNQEFDEIIDKLLNYSLGLGIDKYKEILVD